jgi:AAA domain
MNVKLEGSRRLDAIKNSEVYAMELVNHRGKKETGMLKSGLMVLVGLPKSGKTTFAASFPDSYVLELERGGGDRVAGRIHDIEAQEGTIDLGGEQVPATVLNVFRAGFEAAVMAANIRTIIIDTLDVFSDLVEDEIAKSRGLSAITERKQGVDGFEVWGEYRKRIEGFVAYAKECGKVVLLLAHCKDPKFEQGTVITPAGINIPGKSGPYIAAQADVIGYTYKKEIGGKTEYWLTFQGGPLGIWGSRVEELNDKTIKLPKQDPYGAFAALFEAPKAAPAPAPAAKGANGHGEKKQAGKVLARR